MNTVCYLAKNCSGHFWPNPETIESQELNQELKVSSVHLCLCFECIWRSMKTRQITQMKLKAIFVWDVIFAHNGRGSVHVSHTPCRVEERRGVDDGCTRCIAVCESFASRNTWVTADVKQRIGSGLIAQYSRYWSVKKCLDLPWYWSLRSEHFLSLFFLD